MPTIQNATRTIGINEKDVRDLLDIAQGLGEVTDLFEKSRKRELKLVGDGESLHVAQQVLSKRLDTIARGLYDRPYDLLEVSKAS